MLSGAHRLSEPTALELNAISNSRREKGYRLACQARVAHEGEIGIESLAEQWRKRAVGIIAPDPDSSASENISRTASGIYGFVSDFAASLPGAALHVLPGIFKNPPTLAGIRRYVEDTGRVIRALIAGGS